MRGPSYDQAALFIHLLHEHMRLSSDKSSVLSQGYPFLGLHYLLVSFSLHCIGNLIGIIRCQGALFSGIFESAESIELRLLHKRHQLLKILVGLSWKTHNQGCPDADIRDLLPQLSYQSPDGLARGLSVHGFEYSVADMLNGQVNILTDPFLFLYCMYKTVCKVVRMTVQGANPFQFVGISNLSQQTFKVHPLAQVRSIHGRVLGNEIDLLHTHIHKTVDLPDD